MARRSKPAAAAQEPREFTSKRLKAIDFEIFEDPATLASEHKTANKSLNNASLNDKSISKNITKLDNLPPELQQHIYWLAIKNDLIAQYEMNFYHDRNIAWQLVRVSHAVQQHVVKAAEVWGTRQMKIYVQILMHRHCHDLKRAPACGGTLFPYSRRVERGLVPGCDIEDYNTGRFRLSDLAHMPGLRRHL